MSTKRMHSAHRVSKPRQKDVRNGDGGRADSFIADVLKSKLGHLVAQVKVGGKVAAYTQIANELSVIAGRGDRPWTWRVVRNVIAGIPPGRKFIGALKLLMEDYDPRAKQWFYFLRRRSLAAVFDKSVLREQVISHMEALGFRSVTFKVYDAARKRIRIRK